MVCARLTSTLLYFGAKIAELKISLYATSASVFESYTDKFCMNWQIYLCFGGVSRGKMQKKTDKRYMSGVAYLCLQDILITET